MRPATLVPCVLVLACTEYNVAGKQPVHVDAMPDIVVEPPSLDFGTVAPLCVADTPLTVRNVGDSALQVEGLTLQETDSFLVGSEAISLAPGESRAFEARFMPSADGSYEAEISVHSNDPDEELVIVPVRGDASAVAIAEDIFTQGQNDIDVLWVIDNSGSMNQEQARVVAGITAFFDPFTSLGLDYHMGVITTDVVNPAMSGNLFGEPRWIQADTPNGQGEFSENLLVGVDDMGDESGLYAMELALSEPILSGYNAGFYRPSAALAVIFLSDEPEQSAQDALHYIDFLEGLKPEAARIGVSAIVGDRAAGCTATCDGAANDAQPGDKYIDVVEAFGGLFGSMCTCDISTFLGDIGNAATAPSRTYTLEELPLDASQLEVLVNGAPYAAFTYDAVTNTIVLATAPPEGAEIVARYPVRAGCPQ